MTYDLRIIKGPKYITGPEYREVRATNIEKTRCCILEGLNNYNSSWCYKNSVDKSFFLEWTNTVKLKVDKKMSHLTNKLYTNKHMDCLSSPDEQNALDNIHRNFVAVSIDKATGNIAIVCIRFYACYY